MQVTNRQAIEYFHMLFLQNLPAVLDCSHYAIKGGCNLRFFFCSIRYSEDIDLDIKTVGVKTLEKNIDKLLKSVALKTALKTINYEITDISKPKQTETTQRWKLQLLSHQTNRKTATKIEFSRRGLNVGVIIDRIHQAILDEYNFPRFSSPHYGKDWAMAQKVSALVNRTEPQVRDVFDLDLLIGQKAKLPKEIKLTTLEKKAVEKTIFDMTYEEYISKVVAYLLPQHQITYGDKDIWQEMQLRVSHELT